MIKRRSDFVSKEVSMFNILFKFVVGIIILGWVVVIGWWVFVFMFVSSNIGDVETHGVRHLLQKLWCGQIKDCTLNLFN